jgi:predicted O-methyltransferase YrrM
MPHFNQNYFQPYEAAWNHLLKRIAWKADEPKTVIEVGSYEGSSAYWIMANMLRSPESRLYCIDAWEGDGAQARYELFMRNIDELPARGQIEVMRDWSHKALLKLLQDGVRADLLYIDGSHAAPDVLRDMVLGFELVKPGGFMIGDDYLWADPRFGGQHVLGRPKVAIDAFTTIYGDKLKIVFGMPNNQTYFQKLRD